MKWFLAAAAATSLTAACSPTQAPQTAEAGCAARAQSVWNAGDAGAYAVEAFTEGETCQDASAQLLFRDGSGSVVWTGTYATSQVMTFADVQTAAEMQERLAQWIDQSRGPTTTAQLPEWLPDAEQPMSGEFAFYPDPGVTRDTYEATRARALPLFCYVQGMESTACLFLENGAFQRLGAQSFPG